MENLLLNISLRDKRKPGHCWQDNELYDCFSPIIGANATLVYVHLTRHCYADARIKVTVRELAEACVLSKDTVHRALNVMEHVGMIRRMDAGGRGGRVSDYQLVDLKDLAMSYGAEVDHRRASYVLPAQETTRLKGDVKQYLRKLREVEKSELSKTFVSQGDKTSATDGDMFVSISESFVSISDTFVSKSGSFVSLEGHASSIGQNQDQDSKTTRHPQTTTGGSSVPTPTIDGGGQVQARIDRAQALAAVVKACSFPMAGRIPEAIDQAMSDELLRTKAPPGEIARRMVEAWQEYSALGQFLRYSWGPKKFFLEGHWINSSLWPVDRKALAFEKEKLVGRYR